eukprot:scpid52545/ scgid24061/ 
MLDLSSCRKSRDKFTKDRENLLRLDGVKTRQRLVVFHIKFCLGTGTAENEANDSTDYADLLLFLRKLVSSGNVEMLEQVLQTLEQFDRNRRSPEPSKTSLSVSGTAHDPHDSGGVPEESCIPVGRYQRLKFSAIVGTCSGADQEDALGVDENAQAQGIEFLPSNTSDIPMQQPVHVPPDIELLLNSKYRIFNSYTEPLLFSAILTGHEAVLRCLLKWGADCTHANLACNEMPTAGVGYQCSPLCVAGLLKHAGVVRCLLENGASPYHGACVLKYDLPEVSQGSSKPWTSVFETCRDDSYICELLCQNPANYPPPMLVVCMSRMEDEKDTARRMLPYCLWDACSGTHSFDVYLWNTPWCRSLLDMPCFTGDQHTCRRFCANLALRNLCPLRFRPDNLDIRAARTKELTDIIHHLLRAGAEPAGLSVSEANALCNDWLRVENQEASLRGTIPLKFMSFNEPVQPRPGRRVCRRRISSVDVLAPCVTEEKRHQIRALLPPVTKHLYAKFAAAYFSFGIPPVVDRILHIKSVDDAVVRMLVKHDGLPGITSADSIPMVQGFLHDGPFCQCDVELTPAQREVGVMDVLKSPEHTAGIRRLAHLCRSVVLTACQGPKRTESVQRLGLPPMLVSYILYE